MNVSTTMKRYSNIRVKRQTSRRGIYLYNVAVNLPLILTRTNSSEDVGKVNEMPENGDTDKFHAPNENVWLSTLKLTLNLLSHILISLVVLVCLWFSCRSEKLSVIELHIVLCVLGYQFFMSQGILILSKYNSWSMYLKLRHRRNLHWALEFIGTILIIIGSVYVIRDKLVNFNTLHGILGFSALITTLISILNGAVTSFSAKLMKYGVSIRTCSKYLHAVTGIATLFLSTASLHYGYDKGSFKRWIDNEDFILAIKIFTWMFTIFVGFEFWIIIGKRLYYKTAMSNLK